LSFLWLHKNIGQKFLPLLFCCCRWILDPRSEIRDPRSEIRDPGSGIRDLWSETGIDKKSGSRINIPDSQHWCLHMIKETPAEPPCVTDAHTNQCIWSDVHSVYTRIFGYGSAVIRLPSAGSVLDPDPDPALMTKNWRRKKYSIKFFIYRFWSKIAIYLPLGLHKGRQSYRRSLQPSKEHSVLQKLKFNNFSLFTRAIFALLDPDSDPDPQHWPSVPQN
jgi:hypothetical protein